MDHLIIAVMLTLTCEGHTNAECYPTIREYPTLEACEKARIISGGRSGWAKAIIPDRVDRSSVCFRVLR